MFSGPIPERARAARGSLGERASKRSLLLTSLVCALDQVLT